MRPSFSNCSVAAKWVLPEADREAAFSLFERYAAGEISLIVPDLLLAGFARLIAKRSRRKQISPEQAREARSRTRITHHVSLCSGKR